MKKVFLVLAVGAFLASCGGVDACECGKEMAKDEKDRDKELIDKCTEHYEGLEGDDKKKFDEDSEKCEKDAKKK